MIRGDAHFDPFKRDQLVILSPPASLRAIILMPQDFTV
jgi:hypothetical protein